jgi:hypothetical protein
MHVPAQLGVDDTVLDLTLSYRGSEPATGSSSTGRGGHNQAHRARDVRMTPLGAGGPRRAPGGRDGEAAMAFTIGRVGDTSSSATLVSASLTAPPSTLRADERCDADAPAMEGPLLFLLG